MRERERVWRERGVFVIERERVRGEREKGFKGERRRWRMAVEDSSRERKKRKGKEEKRKKIKIIY